MYYLMPMLMASSASGMGMTTNGVAAMVSTSLTLPPVLFFDALWVIGMVAMMFPAMIPLLLVYNKVVTKAEANPQLARTVGTPLFLVGYLATYALLGLGAYLSISVALLIAPSFPWVAQLSLAIPSAVLIGTGIYQFTPLKNRCLSKCISPLGFFSVHAKRGLAGSFQMGFSHGSYCVGCCWAFMLVMLVVGAMSLPIMGLLSVLIAVEKVVARGSRLYNLGVALLFVFLGVVVWLVPGLLGML